MAGTVYCRGRAFIREDALWQQDFDFVFTAVYASGDTISDTDLARIFRGPNASLPRPDQVRFGAARSAQIAASGLLSSDGTAPLDNETVTIGQNTYRFKTAIALANDILIGASSNASLDNLVAAINGAAGGGTTYHTFTQRNEEVHANARTGTGATGVVQVQAKVPGAGGTISGIGFGNAMGTTDASSHLSWGAAALVGGADTGLVVSFDAAAKKLRLWNGNTDVGTADMHLTMARCWLRFNYDPSTPIGYSI